MLRGGDLTINYRDEGVVMTGNAGKVFEAGSRNMNSEVGSNFWILADSIEELIARSGAPSAVSIPSSSPTRQALRKFGRSTRSA